MLAATADCERDLIRDRVKEGLEAVRTRGRVGRGASNSAKVLVTIVAPMHRYGGRFSATALPVLGGHTTESIT